MATIVSLCLLLLLVPIYLWKVQGWWTLPSANIPTVRLDPALERPARSITDVKDFERGIIVGAAHAETAPVGDIELLARTDAVELLRQSLLKYGSKVKSYTCTLAKQETLNGKLNPLEVTEAWFREEPYSVMMHWKEGAGLAAASLYVTGENEGKMCIRLAGLARRLGVVKNDPDDSKVKANTRYLITEFGLRCGTERTYKAWKGLSDSGVTLQIEYLGLRKNIPEAGGRDCHVIKRTCPVPEEDGMTDVTIFIDAESWFQVGSILKAGDKLIGSYWFRDIVINPAFDDKQFKPETLKKY